MTVGIGLANLNIDRASSKELHSGGMAEWFKATVLKTVDRKVRGFESYSLRQLVFQVALAGEVAEMAEGIRLLSGCGEKSSPRVRIPPSPPSCL